MKAVLSLLMLQEICRLMPETCTYLPLNICFCSRRGGIRGVCKDFTKERWMHDRYIEEEQAPKTRAELIKVYGYDIRSQNGKNIGSVESRGR